MEVALKKMQKIQLGTTAKKEIEMMLKLGKHPNIVDFVDTVSFLVLE